MATDSIYFDFLSDSGLEDNIAFRLKVLFGENKVYLQSLVGGEWFTDEEDVGFPFALGQDFEVEFVAEQSQWKVLVNKEEFCTYTYRYAIELSRVLYIHVAGPVTITSITPGGPGDITINFTSCYGFH